MRSLYRIHDYDDDLKGCFEVKESEALSYNGDGWGIFWTVNEFNGPRRRVNLSKIRSWYVEMDGDKDEQYNLIDASPIFPSMVIESKHGYHVYFDALDATTDRYAEIQKRVLHFFGGDKRAKDLSRLLRVPGFYNWKDKDPFLVTTRLESGLKYSQEEMLYFFGPVPQKEPILTLDSKMMNGGTLRDRLNSLNHKSALEHFSGSPLVNYEVYDFTPVADGKLNILVNGKSTSCFIDSKGMIGAVPGGPTIWQWLKYFGHSDSDIGRILFEELGL